MTDQKPMTLAAAQGEQQLTTRDRLKAAEARLAFEKALTEHYKAKLKAIEKILDDYSDADCEGGVWVGTVASGALPEIVDVMRGR